MPSEAAIVLVMTVPDGQEKAVRAALGDVTSIIRAVCFRYPDAVTTCVALLSVALGCSSAESPAVAGAEQGGGDPAAAIDGDGADESSELGDVGDDEGAVDESAVLEGAVGALDFDGDAPVAVADDSDLVAAPAETLAATRARTTANLNLRTGPGTGYKVVLVIPRGAIVSILSSARKNAFYNIQYNGRTGWSHSAYLKAVTSSPSPSPVDPNGPPSPANAVARARASRGFSYWWGGGAWLAGGATASNKGRCSGSCPSCSHSGRYGADCSGMVGKAWQFGVKTLSVNSHPYSTASFVRDVAGKWRTVSRGGLRKADALVYNSGGGGHIVLWEKGNGWGQSTVYECKGCSYGCVYNTRSFSSAYKGIRRAGF